MVWTGSCMKETGMFCSGKSEWSGHGHGVAWLYKDHMVAGCFWGESFREHFNRLFSWTVVELQDTSWTVGMFQEVSGKSHITSRCIEFQETAWYLNIFQEGSWKSLLEMHILKQSSFRKLPEKQNMSKDGRRNSQGPRRNLVGPRRNLPDLNFQDVGSWKWSLLRSHLGVSTISAWPWSCPPVCFLVKHSWLDLQRWS